MLSVATKFDLWFKTSQYSTQHSVICWFFLNQSQSIKYDSIFTNKAEQPKPCVQKNLCFFRAQGASWVPIMYKTRCKCRCPNSLDQILQHSMEEMLSAIVLVGDGRCRVFLLFHFNHFGNPWLYNVTMSTSLSTFATICGFLEWLITKNVLDSPNYFTQR